MKPKISPAIVLVLFALSGCATGAEDTVVRVDGAPLDAHESDTSIDGAADTTTGVDGSMEDAAEADSTSADEGTADTIVADTFVADTTVTDTTAPDTFVPDTFVADTFVPDTFVPDTFVPDTFVPDTFVADTFVEDTSSTDTSADTSPPCPTALSLGTFDVDTEGWTFDGLWRRDSASASMVAGSTTKYSSSYTQNLTNPANVDLSGCTSATLSYSVRLADDPDYFSKGPDKSERLYVQCSGDGGATWTNLIPTTWPPNQSACATSYCCGGPGAGRSFPLTAQTTTLPAACRTATARFRFQAKGSSVWNLMNPGWWVDSVKLN